MFQKRKFVTAHVANAHRSAQHDQDANRIQIGRYFIPAVKMPNFRGNPKIAEYRHNPARSLIFHMLQNNRFAHPRIRRLRREDVKFTLLLKAELPTKGHEGSRMKRRRKWRMEDGAWKTEDRRIDL